GKEGDVVDKVNLRCFLPPYPAYTPRWRAVFKASRHPSVKKELGTRQKTKNKKVRLPSEIWYILVNKLRR
ncbi:MAG: hypothetical protein PHW17_11635, partial [Desulfobacterales bacterium]|nr:hypothetical protein [Desulfobacterales bacterium]